MTLATASTSATRIGTRLSTEQRERHEFVKQFSSVAAGSAAYERGVRSLEDARILGLL